MAELRIGPGILGIRGHAIYVGFAYLVPPRWALGVDVRPPAERLPEPNGSPRNGKIEELRLESVILGVRGSVFCLPFVATHLRWIRVFSAPALDVWRRCPPPAGSPPETQQNATEGYGAVK